ncbi:aminopeptidase N [Legionella quateirensis]|uniref:Aminopeptidase N n=1 Tax=Legionella quateirensis TaxID=45072 RepID=A0A378L1A7_9GAMM|nr:aminopeptidase N [Legionella quateirensis]KTD50874.1 aminopeptidase N [Legionella quateirensis]STY17880.1 aminopeptidase N [Legionella quateirensis]
MKESKSKVFNLSDYKILDYLVKHVDLEINLSKDPVQTQASITVLPNSELESHSKDLILDGENMQLTSILLNGNVLEESQYELTEHSLIIKNVPQGEPFILTTTTLLGENTDLFGLYKTEGTVLVKAETEGLRRLLYCNDRPDNLATYKTTIIAKEQDYPVLLCNGKVIGRVQLSDGLHSVTWMDDVPKPSYLFAMVAGNLQRSEAHFRTRSGRDLPIVFYVPPAATEKCAFAKEVLAAAMAWDERTYNLECDLHQHMVAGVDKYASGASEPTGLNLFNTANLFARPESTTDLGILRVLEVVAHEFFHYWSGDRVTIRDWFNLSFKEGLTTFRAAMFREELLGTDLVRLLDGKNLDLRAPRQSSYTAVRSLYTAAAYEKSADIFRMMMLTLGKELFYKGMTEFLKTHDGKAVTLENMLESLTNTSGVNVHPFLSWFTEPGIPELNVMDAYNQDTKTYTLKVKTIDGKARPIPLIMGLLDHSGKELKGDTLLMIDQPEMEFTFNDVESRPVPSLLRSFSAPVYLNYPYSQHELLVLMQHDTNIYNRCEAAKSVVIQMIKDFCADKPLNCTPQFINSYRAVLADKSLNEWLQAELLTLPSEEDLALEFAKPDFDKIAEGRQLIQKALAQELQADLFKCYNELQLQEPASSPQFSIFDIKDAGCRRLKEVCSSYFQFIDSKQTEQYLELQFRGSLKINMTETYSALKLLCEMDSSKVDGLLKDYYQHWKNDATAVNYWFTIQASTHSPSVVQRVEELTHHPAFDLSNPNKVYALLRSFIKNPYGFHAKSGQGYQLIADKILLLDKINPTLAAGLTENFVNWEKFDESRQNLMLLHLKQIYSNAVSDDVRNAAKKGLDKVRDKPPLPIHLTILGGTSIGETSQAVHEQEAVQGYVQ